MNENLMTNTQTVPSVRSEAVSEVAKAIMAISLSNEEVAKLLKSHIAAPFDVSTPKEKVKKRPDGFDYIESSWMDNQFKSHSPLYASELLHYSESHGWITCIVRLTDRVTNNSELGGASVRIQVKKGSGPEPTFSDIIDKGNNVAAVVTRAIKNAQSRFGHGADIYGKREAVRTNEEKERFASMLIDLTKLAPNRKDLFQTGWDELGADFSDYLDRWDIFLSSLKKNSKRSSVEKKVTSAEGAVVTEDKSPKILTL